MCPKLKLKLELKMSKTKNTQKLTKGFNAKTKIQTKENKLKGKSPCRAMQNYSKLKDSKLKDAGLCGCARHI